MESLHLLSNFHQLCEKRLFCWSNIRVSILWKFENLYLGLSGLLWTLESGITMSPNFCEKKTRGTHKNAISFWDHWYDVMWHREYLWLFSPIWWVLLENILHIFKRRTPRNVLQDDWLIVLIGFLGRVTLIKGSKKNLTLNFVCPVIGDSPSKENIGVSICYAKCESYQIVIWNSLYKYFSSGSFSFLIQTQCRNWGFICVCNEWYIPASSMWTTKQ